MQDFRQFLKEITTLKTVWIDKGQGKWVVKKRLHPFLRGVIVVTAVVIGASVYMNLPAFKNALTSQKAEAEPEVKISRLIDYEPDNLKASLPTIDIPDSKPEPVAMNRDKLTFPANDMIITEPEKLFKPVPVKREPVAKDYDDDYSDGKYRILVSKSTYTLSLFKGNNLVKEYPIAVGRNPGDKQRVGDHRTPTGNFKIVSIEDASKWKHDFGDGKGKIAGAYGPWFLRLDAKGWKGIGIHGTHDPDSRGTMATEGCIRLSNEDIAELRRYAYRNMPVTIREN